MPFNRGTIKHSGGRNKTKHGLSLRDLPFFLQKYLVENNQFKEVEDDKVIEILFKMRELEFRNNHTRKIYYCPFTYQPSTIDEILNNADKVEHECFHCSSKIYSIYNVFTYRNLICDSCYIEHKGEHDKKAFADFTNVFRKAVQDSLDDERKFLIKYIKQNSKIKLLS